jgi:PAS domain S-box-containing protein
MSDTQKHIAQDESDAYKRLTPHEQLQFIQNAAKKLSRANSVEEIARVMLAQCQLGLGASAVSISMLAADRLSLSMASSLGYPPSVKQEMSRYPATANYPSAHAALSGNAIFIETLVERNRQYPHLVRNSAHMERGAIAVLPLIVKDTTLGSLVLNFSHDRNFPEDDRVFIQTLTQICAQALGCQMEVDERRLAEQAVHDGEARKAAMLEAALDCIITIDDQGVIIDWNPAAERTFGYSREQAVGSILADLIIPSEQRAAHWQGIRHYLETGEGPILGTRIEVVAENSKGENVPIEVAILPIRLVSPNLFTAYARDISERQLMASKQWTLVRDILLAVTDSKLRLCQTHDDLPLALTAASETLSLTKESGVAGLRHLADDMASQIGFSTERRYDLQTAVSEAGMNAIVHGGGGEGAVRLEESKGTLQVHITDRGKGIAIEQLPAAALTRGFSTAASLGHGLKMMVETSDRVYLLTNPSGTTTILEMDRDQPLPPWLIS